MRMNGRYLALFCLIASGVLDAGAVDGSWSGELSVGISKLRLVLNFQQNDGATSCTMDSPSQNAYGLPAVVDYESADSIAVSIGSIGASFSGRIASDEIKGTFTQRGYQFPLTLQRELPLTQRRPQTPVAPFPYQVIDTVFRSADGTQLAGTLALPGGYDRGKTPICVFVTGSGPQNRDEELFEHRPFAVIADYLARNGVASFRYDDRGIAESKGDFAAATTATFAEDAKAALLFARNYGDRAAGIVGHSEGGTIALLLAEEGLPDFIVSLAGMAVSGKETVMAQNKRQLESMGFDRKAVDDCMVLLDQVFDEIICQADSGVQSAIDVDAMAAELGVTLPDVLAQSLKSNLANSTGYFGVLLSIDARKGMGRITCPVLALNGSLDVQVDAAKNLDAIRNGVKHAEAEELPGLNHLFQHACTGEVSEYAEIRETISPDVLRKILTFVLKIV